MRILTRLQATILLFSLTGAAWSQQLPAPVAAALKSADIPLFASSVYVRDVNGATPLLAWNATEPFSPASTMKLLTTDAALELLGPAFTWKTQAYADGVQDGDVLRGDLVIKGSGDPKLVFEDFWLFLRRIRAAGIREIRGDLVLDRSAFAPTDYDPASFDGEPLKTYNAGPDALLLNYKALGFRFTPDQAAHKVQVTTDPSLASFSIDPPALASGGCGDWRGGLRPEIDGSGARFDGTYPASCGEQSWYLHPYQMSRTRYFDLVFRNLWHELGGIFSGEVRSGTLPPNARLVAEWESPPVAEVIRDVNKFSNNVMAKQLLLTLANQVLKLQATTGRGAAAIKVWLGNKGIAAPELVMENGSGLSRLERISATTMGELLVAAFRSPVMPEFVASLPLAAEDGTMRHRLQNTPAAGQAHIKTGSLAEVRAIAGYMQAASGKRYAVVCFVNHHHAERAMPAEDALLEWVYQHG